MDYGLMQCAKPYIKGPFIYSAYTKGTYMDRTYIDRTAWDRKGNNGLSGMTVQSKIQRNRKEDGKV